MLHVFKLCIQMVSVRKCLNIVYISSVNKLYVVTLYTFGFDADMESEMTSQEAAQAIFPGIARALQKYLRVTRQQPRYTMEMILDHLSECINHNLSAKTFIQKYLNQSLVIWDDKDYETTKTWTIVSDKLLNSSIKHGTQFRLQQGEVSLLIHVRKLPHFNVVEDVVESNKFVLRLNSETSV